MGKSETSELMEETVPTDVEPTVEVETKVSSPKAPKSKKVTPSELMTATDIYNGLMSAKNGKK